MSDFTPKTWKDGEGGGTPITAAELNRIEAGIAEKAAKGDPGPKGDPGTQGPKGEPGPKGDPGEPADTSYMEMNRQGIEEVNGAKAELKELRAVTAKLEEWSASLFGWIYSIANAVNRVPGSENEDLTPIVEAAPPKFEEFENTILPWQETPEH